jgi:hypothetical protein
LYDAPVIRALKLGAIAAAAFLAVGWLFSLWLMPYLRARSMPAAKVAWALQFPQTNLVALGPSYVEMGFNPDVFDAAMRARGRDIHSFNLGIDGLSLAEMQAMIEELLAKHPCCIKYFLLSPCYECLNVAQIPDSARSISFFNGRRGAAFLRDVLLYPQLPSENVSRLDYVRNVSVAVFRHHSNLGVAANRFGFSQFEGQVSPNLLAASYWNARPRGFEPVDQVMSGADARRYEAGLEAFAGARAARLQAGADGPGGIVSDGMFDAFLTEVRYLRARGIAVLALVPPNQGQWQYHADFIAKLRQRCGDDIPLLDFGDPGRWRDLFLPAAIRRDDQHMNAAGAARWSEALAGQVATWMAAAPAEPAAGICR